MLRGVQWPAPGRYVVAVSGGADSMVLLDVLAAAASEREYELVVAHFDHGLRADSAADRQLVEEAAARYGLPFETHAAGLGRASEADARDARHDWLESVRRYHDAAAILTAHHQDDLLETSLLNLARGTGRLGLAPMQSAPAILRPLIGQTRSQLRVYAHDHQLTWHEDPTNSDLSNPRNFLRHRLLPAAASAWRERYLQLIGELAALNHDIAAELDLLIDVHRQDPAIFAFPQAFIRGLSDLELSELISAAARRLNPGIQLDQKLITEITEFARTRVSGKYRPLRSGVVLLIAPGFVKLTTKTPH